MAPKDKPWFTREVRDKLKIKKAEFRIGDKTRFKAAKYGLKRAIHKAKAEYGRKWEEQFAFNNLREVWQGIQQATQYKDKNFTSPNPYLR